ncbi:hypothetical protein GQ54DRAFT_14996 [Martensiomyces pterosporus]|nr:hypothetical protein GQ54DRAFT_14996 [Martensiomyces pterosporus]
MSMYYHGSNELNTSSNSSTARVEWRVRARVSRFCMCMCGVGCERQGESCVECGGGCMSKVSTHVCMRMLGASLVCVYFCVQVRRAAVAVCGGIWGAGVAVGAR